MSVVVIERAHVGRQARVVDAKTKEGLDLYDGARGVIVELSGALFLRRGLDSYLPITGPHAVIVELL